MEIPPPQRVYKRDEAFTVAVRPEFAIGDWTPWCVEVDGAWYELDRFDPADPDYPWATSRFFRQSLSQRGPFWLAHYPHPLLIRVNDVVVRCRTRLYRGRPFWHFQLTSDELERGMMAKPEHTVADVEKIAAFWLASRDRADPASG